MAEMKSKKRIIEVFDDERDLFGFKIWRIPLEKIEKDNKNIYLFFSFQVISQLIVVKLIIPFFNTEAQITMMYFISSFVFGLTMVLYIYLLICDPGKLKPETESLYVF